MIKNIIFDFGGVLIKWIPDLVYDNYFSSSEDKQNFYQTTNIFEVNKEMDRGMPFDKALSKLSENFPAYSEPIWFWKTRWKKMIDGEISETVNILNELYNKNYQLFGLTNWSDETFPYVYEKYDFFKKFKDILVSGKENFIKPEPEIYKLLLSRNSILAEESVFIDDSIHNVNAAKKLGISGIHFVSPLKLREELLSLGLL